MSHILSRIVDPHYGYRIVDIDSLLLAFIEQQVTDSIISNCIKYNLFTPETTSLDSLLSALKNSPAFSGFSLSERTIARDHVAQSSDFLCSLIGQAIGIKPDFLVNNNLYYRLVRTDIERDISVVHRDIYFHNILPEWNQDPHVLDIKLWAPLYLSHDTAIGVIPGSHLDTDHVDCTYQYSHGKKVSFTSTYTSNDLSAVDVSVGQALLFPSSLLHGSLQPSSRGPIRLSAELTLGFNI